MPSIEQVSKRLFSDADWLKKCGIGVLLSIVPIVNIVAMGYLYRLFAAGKRGQGFALAEWDDIKGLALDGLRFCILFLVFVVLPVGLIYLGVMAIPTVGILAQVALIPALFFAAPLLSAALYLYQFRNQWADSFNFEALQAMLKGAFGSYLVPTLAYAGYCALCGALYPLYFVGSVVYFYMMGFVFRELELSKRQP